MSKKLIYISGKYGGKEENKIDMECAIKDIHQPTIIFYF